MRRFAFRLQKVLEYRQLLEEQAKDAYVAAQSTRQGAEAGLAHIADRRRTMLLQVVEGIDGYRSLELALVRTDDDERAQRAALAVLEDEERQALQAWTARRMDLEALVKLRNRSLEEWQLEASRREQAELDEWAVTRRSG
jgi:flagellar export protein FliJ